MALREASVKPSQPRSFSRRSFLAALGTAAVSVGLRLDAAHAAAPVETTFPKDFLWGAATSAYQIEGAVNEDGRAPSIWDAFVRKPGAIWQEQTGNEACDHYHRYRDDVALMKTLSLRAYRFSVSWPRVLPAGAGAANEKGLDFYQRLVDALLAANIKPVLTLYHWDLPQALQERGGWMNRDSAGWFADFAALVASRLSDRVAYWITVNEPRSFIGAGYRLGVHAPGEQRPMREALQAGHHLLLAHGRGVQAIRASARPPVQVSIGLDFSPCVPATDSAEDVAAARAATFGGAPPSEGLETWWQHNVWWTDPVLRGAYPGEALEILGGNAPEVASGDLETMHQPLDYFALNLYGGWPVRAGKDGRPEPAPPPPGAPLTAFNWPVVPESLRWAPVFLHERYRLPILVTENGLTCRDWVSLDGKVHDPQRIDFTARYLLELHRAMREGVPVRGYLHWTLMDNFEWHTGFRERFGLIYVDFATQKRIPKDSARWYARVIASNGKTLGEF
jgi:beta-glucosidase